MKISWINLAVVSLSVGTLTFVGCGPSKEPTGPDEGSVQAYLDANPEAAARIDEEVDEGEDDGTGE
ncbi:hypothetical protein Enr13x_17160 [Stieleria neptunia]|uniref:Uncharacterized protein n=1 Tax=Stieleria neptunia TaxID=2527979 RepID=A0A518HLZ5_9BACT|nr:hypothetical protein [Stieleria neptunia]QDV41873.1 hypothetical protein Enr13x_17160 [Stieleria neptunia]